MPDKTPGRNLDLGRLSKLLKNVECCRERIESHEEVFAEYLNWKSIRFNVEVCRRELQSLQTVLDPDPKSPPYQEFITRLNEINYIYALANYEVERAFDAVGKANSCLAAVRAEAQLVSQSFRLKRRWAKALAELSRSPDLNGLERCLTEIMELTIKPRSRGGQKDDRVSTLKEEVRQCWIRHQRPRIPHFCKNLDDDKVRRPPNVKWAGDTWQSAYTTDRNSVDKWLSGCLKPVRDSYPESSDSG